MLTITVAIPCFNGAQFIGNCIESISAQSHPPDEIIVVDDGSTDTSSKIISKYPVRLLQHDRNLGLAEGRNTALANTDTDLIVYVDVDAYAKPNMISSLVSEFEKDNIGGAGGQGIEAVQDSIYDRWRRLHASQNHGRIKLSQCDHLFGLCMAYRTEVLRSVDGFNPLFRTNAEDIDIGYRLNDAGYSLVYTPEAKVLHQRKDDRASLKKMMHQWYYWGFIAKKENKRNPWRLLGGTLKRVLWSDTWKDLLINKSLALTILDVEISLVKIRALLQASRSMKFLINCNYSGVGKSTLTSKMSKSANK